MQWASSNGDFGFCQKHNTICEIVPLQDPKQYSSDCNRCLIGKSLSQHFDKHIPLQDSKHLFIESRQKLLDFFREDTGLSAMQRQAQQKALIQAEQAAFIQYYINIWRILYDVRKEARLSQQEEEIKQSENGPRRTRTLPPSALRKELIEFQSHLTTRNGKQAGSFCCFTHDKLGDTVPHRDPSLYESCGVCVKTRVKSKTDQDKEVFDLKLKIHQKQVETNLPKNYNAKTQEIKPPPQYEL